MVPLVTTANTPDTAELLQNTQPLGLMMPTQDIYLTMNSLEFLIAATEGGSRKAPCDSVWVMSHVIINSAHTDHQSPRAYTFCQAQILTI